ncbi:MAG: alpha/beta fold hydrolase [Vicinamibacteria bacterium]
MSRRAKVLGRVAFYGAVVFGLLPLAFSQIMLRLPRQPASPVHPPFEEAFVASEGLRLRTWTVVGRPDRAAVVAVHGLGDTLESYTEHARVLHRRGHTVLLVDLRAHGGSEGRDSTLGGRERADVRAAARHLRERGLARAGIVLMGFSLGTAAVMGAAPDEPDVRAVVLEAPFDTARGTIAHHGWLLYRIPAWFPLGRLALAIAGWRAGFDPDEIDLVRSAGRLRAPLFTIVDGDDPRMPEAVVRRVFDAHPGPKQIWVAPGVPHVGASVHPDYWTRVVGFFEAHGV